MEKIFKFVGVVLLVAIGISGVLYLLDVAGLLELDMLLGQFGSGIQGSLGGIQQSVSRMFNR